MPQKAVFAKGESVKEPTFGGCRENLNLKDETGSDFRSLKEGEICDFPDPKGALREENGKNGHKNLNRAGKNGENGHENLNRGRLGTLLPRKPELSKCGGSVFRSRAGRFWKNAAKN